MLPELHYHLFLVIFIWIFSNFLFLSMLSTLTLFFSENSKIRIFLRLLFIPEFSPPYYVLCTTLAPLLQNELSVIFVYYSIHKYTRFDSAFMYSQNLHHHPLHSHTPLFALPLDVLSTPESWLLMLWKIALNFYLFCFVLSIAIHFQWFYSFLLLLFKDWNKFFFLFYWKNK